jgi:hypothetical protein
MLGEDRLRRRPSRQSGGDLAMITVELIVGAILAFLILLAADKLSGGDS